MICLTPIFAWNMEPMKAGILISTWRPPPLGCALPGGVLEDAMPRIGFAPPRPPPIFVTLVGNNPFSLIAVSARVSLSASIMPSTSRPFESMATYRNFDIG